ncbi:MAG: FAD/NAD(P)-binding protein [Candidatus ainarchaeum sp.]|nr:FAD/NAD(P)-binding protein [Candidatus ainarchaeum sp.]
MHDFESPLKPELAEILRVKQETPSIKTFTVRFLDKKKQKQFSFLPGKFMMASIFGFGEMPISISSSPYQKDSLQLTVNPVGNISRKICSLEKGSVIGLRGPFGRGYPIQKFRKKNIVFFSGGCGMASMRSAVFAVTAKKELFGKLFLFHGCKSPSELLFAEDIAKWEKEENFNVFVSVDVPSPSWKGNSGFVTDLIGKVDLPIEDTFVLMCGPQAMMNIAIEKFKGHGFKPEQLYSSLERLMHCGVGKCGHCNIGKEFVCVHGPVFSGLELEKMHLKEG